MIYTFEDLEPFHNSGGLQTNFWSHKALNCGLHGLHIWALLLHLVVLAMLHLLIIRPHISLSAMLTHTPSASSCPLSLSGSCSARCSSFHQSSGGLWEFQFTLKHYSTWHSISQYMTFNFTLYVLLGKYSKSFLAVSGAMDLPETVNDICLLFLVPPKG